MKISKNIIFALVAIVLIGEIIWAGRTLTQSISINKNGNTVPSPTKSPENTISLKTPSKTLKVGGKAAVTIGVSSSRPTDGTDIIIKYDPNLLSVVTSSPSGIPVNVGSMYSAYPVNKLDEKNGRIVVSGISTSSEGVIPLGAFGVVVFKAKAVGKTQVALDFTPGNTVDSNIIDSKTSKDILKKVENIDFDILP